MFISLFFYFIYSVFLIFFSLNIVFTKNTIYSLLSLILVFFFSSFLFIQLGLDYIPLIFIIIYVGALSVLFLFVIMMLNIKIYSQRNNLFYIFFLSFICYFVFYYIYYLEFAEIGFLSVSNFYFGTLYSNKNIIIILGILLFSTHSIYMYLTGLVLFIGILGSVYLVLEVPKNLSKTQKPFQQIGRFYKNAYFKL